MMGTTSKGLRVSHFLPSSPFFFSMTGGAVTLTPPAPSSPIVTSGAGAGAAGAVSPSVILGENT